MPPKKKTGAKPKASPKARAPRKTEKVSEKKSAPKLAKAVKASLKTNPAKASRATESKKTPAPPKASATSSRDIFSISKKIPKRGETQMVAFIRDPQCLFTYWEVTPESIEAVKNQLKNEYKNSSMVLRVFRKGFDGQIELIQEIFVGEHEMNRYIQINDPRGSYFLEIAQRGPSGQILVYARSNSLATGPSGFSVSSPAQAAANPQWETPAGIMEYFSQEEFMETFLTPGGPSSSDNLKRKKGRYASSNIR